MSTNKEREKENMNKKSKWTLLVAVTVVTVGAGVNYRILSAKADTNQSGRTVKEIKKSGEIKIAVFGDLKPYGWVDKNGKRQGYDIELAKKVAKDLGVKVKYVQVNANARVDALSLIHI